MFYISNVICSDFALAQILGIIRRIVNILGIVIPILLLIGASITFAKGTIDPENTKVKKKVTTSIASAVIVLLLPFIINITMQVINTYAEVGISENGSNVALDISSCWNSSDSANNNSSNNTTTYTSDSISSETTSVKNKSSNSSKSSTKSNTKRSYKKLVLVGDSRFVGQQSYNLTDSKTTYIAKTGEGYNYLQQVENQIKRNDSKSSVFVINMGVNDLYNVSNYVTYITDLANQLQGKLYFLSVNPVDEAVEKQYGYSVKNSDIDTFNKTIKKNLKNVTYINSNSYLKKNGFTTTDGVHYTEETYTKIYNYILKKIS